MERLERIKQWYDNVGSLAKGDVDWLIEQAEKSGAVHSRHFLMDTINKQQEKINLLEKLIKEFDNHLGTEEESEFIHVFQRVLIHHHMDSKFTNPK